MNGATALPVAPGPPTAPLLDAAEAMLGGRGPLRLPHAADDAPPSLPAEADVPAGGILAVGTSGSTGQAKRAVLTAAALRASIDATHVALGGPGRWLLALPAHHIAGLQVVLRSLRAGHAPAGLPAGPFSAPSFARAARAMSGRRRYVSLVPTQLARIVADPDATRALADLDAVLLGGAPVPPGLREAALAAGARIVTTYGMSETAGGCVYDGVPLSGVHLTLDDDDVILLGGETLALGYLPPVPPAAHAAFGTDDTDRRWFRTADHGRLDENGRLVVTGRVDDVVITGGLKVAPRVVEDALHLLLPPGSEVIALGVPDAQWGQSVAVAVAPPPGVDPGTVDLARLVLLARERLPAHALPRRGLVLAQLPHHLPGKVDRHRLRQLLAQAPALR